MAIVSDPRELASLQRKKGSAKLNPSQQSERKTVRNMVERVRQDIEVSYRYTRDWRVKALESYDFVENRQWEHKDEAKLLAEGRAILTLNKILPIIRIIAGIERQNRTGLRVYPRFDADVAEASLMTQLIQFVDSDNFGQFERTHKTQDVLVCGRGYIKTDINFDENIVGDVYYRRRDPLGMFVDPNHMEWTGLDARWIADGGTWVTEDEAKDMFPEFADQFKFGEWLKGNADATRTESKSEEIAKLFLDRDTRRIRLLEYWYRKYVNVEVAVHRETGDVVVATDQFKLFHGKLPPEEKAKINIIKRRVGMVRVATLLNWMLLQDKPSPYDHRQFPIIPYVGIQYRSEPYGMVEYLKDPQKLRNKTMAQLLNHLNRSANSGWLNMAQGGADPGVLEKFGSQPGVVIDYEVEKPERIEPVPMSQGHFNLLRDSDLEIKEISLINAELQGLTTQVTVSGEAIKARQKGGLVGNEDFFDNQLLGDKLLGFQLISLIQQVYTPSRISRIVKSQSGRDPQGDIAKALRGNKLPQIIDRAMKAEYDFEVDHGPNAITERRAQFKMLTEAAAKFPGSIPPALMVELSDAPPDIKARILEHIEKQEAIALQGQTGQTQ